VLACRKERAEGLIAGQRPLRTNRLRSSGSEPQRGDRISRLRPPPQPRDRRPPPRARSDQRRESTPCISSSRTAACAPGTASSTSSSA